MSRAAHACAGASLCAAASSSAATPPTEGEKASDTDLPLRSSSSKHNGRRAIRLTAAAGGGPSTGSAIRRCSPVKPGACPDRTGLMDARIASAIAANRFGLGARPGELERIESDPRGWLRAQLEGPPPVVTGDGLPSTAEILGASIEGRGREPQTAGERPSRAE